MIEECGRVGVLSTLSAPLLPVLLEELRSTGMESISIILDAKTLGSKDREIWRQRTEGNFDDQSPNIYDFCFSETRFYLTQNHNSDQCEKLLRSLNIDLLLNGGTPRRLDKTILSSARLGAVNVHPGLLPKYRGSCCVEWAILNNDPVGNTAHFMVEGYDEGPIITRESYEVLRGEDYATVRSRVYRAWAPLMARTARWLIDENKGFDDFPPQGHGKLHQPMGAELLNQVKNKLASGQYQQKVLRA